MEADATLFERGEWSLLAVSGGAHMDPTQPTRGENDGQGSKHTRTDEFDRQGVTPTDD